MIQVDLITGFLGAGKTSFLMRYAKYLLSKGQRLGILVYDHGAVNVDLPLLNSLRSDRCELETLAASCDADCHRRRFRTRLIAMAMSGYDRILIEPSGVFDMDEFFDAIHEEPLDRWLEIGNIICVVDAKLPDDSLPEEDYFLASEAACAGAVVLSRVQLAQAGELHQAVAHLRTALRKIHSSDDLDSRLFSSDWAKLTEAEFDAIARSGYRLPDYVKRFSGTAGFQSLSFLNLSLGSAALREKTDELIGGPVFGRVLRVKGFFRENGNWYELNATEHACRIREAAESHAVLTVIGLDLNENAIHLLLTGEQPALHIL